MTQSINKALEHDARSPTYEFGNFLAQRVWWHGQLVHNHVIHELAHCARVSWRVGSGGGGSSGSCSGGVVAVKITCQWQSTIGTTKETTERNTMERKNREEEQRAVSIVVPK